MKIAYLLPAIFLCAATAGATITEQLLDQLKTELKAEALTAREKGDDRNQQQFYRLQELLMQIQRSPSLDEGDANLQQSVEALGNFTLSDKIEGICKALADEMRTAQEKREQSLTAEMERTFAESLRTALAGKTATDVDGPLVAVAKLARNNGNRSTRNTKLSSLINEGQQLWEFLRQWQDYLAANDASNAADAKQKLQNLVGYGRDFSSFMPRSELLSRLNALQKSIAPAGEKTAPINEAEYFERMRAILDTIKTLDDIPAALPRLVELNAAGSEFHGRRQVSLISIISNLRGLIQSRDDIRRGLSTRINLMSLNSRSVSSTSEEPDVIAPLRLQLLLLAIPVALGVPEELGLKPEENPGTYLQRILAVAREKEDWTLAGRILEVAQYLNAGAVASTNDSTTLRSFLAGLNQERAGQFSLAVVSYQAALKTGSQFITPELIGTHLAAIKKTSPADFEKGMELTLNPPAAPEGRSSYDPRNRGYPPGFPGSAQPTATPTPASFLEVPAKIAPPTATPTPLPTPPTKQATPPAK